MNRNFSRSASAFSPTKLGGGVGNVVSHSAFSGYRVQEPQHEWWVGVTRRFDALCSLPKGWDGYSAPPVSFANTNFAASLLASACPELTPTPQLVPGPNGDLQIEWHDKMWDIELHILAPYSVDAWRNSTVFQDCEEQIRLKADFTLIASWLKELSEGKVAVQTSAA